MLAPKRDTKATFARWRRVSLRAQGVAVLAFPIAALFAALFSIYWAETGIGSADRTISRAFDAHGAVLQLQSSLLDAEAARGAYLATGQARFLSAYESARVSIGNCLARLPSLVAGSAAAMAGLRRVDGMA